MNQEIDNGLLMGMGIPPGITSMIIQGGPSMMQMGNNDDISEGARIYDEEVEENKLDITEDDVDKYSDHSSNKSDNQESMSDSASDIGSDSDSFTDEEKSSCSEEEGEEGKTEVKEIKIEGIQGKGNVVEIEENDDKIDRSLSIKELKNICQKMKLSTSGNKEQLINRIKNKKNI